MKLARVLLLCIVLTGCQTYRDVKSAEFKDRLTYLKIGMNENQLLDLLGKPDEKITRAEQTLYLFELESRANGTEKRQITVVVEDGRVTDQHPTHAGDFTSDVHP